MMGKRLYIETWGCQMNRHDTERLRGAMEAGGFRLVEELVRADVVLFVGCMVRQKAEEKVFGRMGMVVEEKRRRRVLFGVGGCLGAVRGQGLLDRFSMVDFAFGTEGFQGLPEWIDDASRSGVRAVYPGGPDGPAHDPVHRYATASAMVTIAEGCSNYCSYCIVPFARGPMRSRDPERILEEVDAVVSEGYREVLLLGQNVNSYGRDREDVGTFAGLLRRVAERGPNRVRFTSAHPRDVDEDLLRAMAEMPNVMPHLHVACQSGSDQILAAMNRGTTAEGLRRMIERARSIIPGLNVTTDLIVGFPGETEEDFLASLRLLETGRFGSVFAAKYSPRPGTRSASWADDVPDGVKNERLQRVLRVQRAIAEEMNHRLVGSTQEVLVEGRDGKGALYGRLPDHRTVIVRATAGPGDLLDVEIVGADAASLRGEPVPAFAAAARGKETE